MIPAKKAITKVVIASLIILFNISSTLHGQDVSITLHKENITVLSDEEGFVTEVFCRGKSPAGKNIPIKIIYGELEKISDLKVTYKDEKGRVKQLKKDAIQNHSILTSTFYSGYRAYSFSFDFPKKDLEFEYSYKISCNKLIFMTLLPFSSSYKTDTFSYEIQMPAYYHLLSELSGDTSFLSAYKFEEKENAGNKYYKIFATPKDQLWKRMVPDEPFLYSARPAPVVRLLVLPDEKKNESFSYFNNWYKALLNPTTQLNDNTKKWIDEAVNGKATPQEKAEAIFKAVKSKIAYISLENGIRAVQPHDVNRVLDYMQGDCKDMANLLCQSLRYIGLEANMALSSTLSHYSDLTFPSLSSANHAICVLKLNKQYIFLDATEPDCKFGFPSMHIQDRNIFIINENSGELVKVPHVSAAENKTLCNLELQQTDNTLKGEISYHFNGLAKTEIESEKNRFTPRDFAIHVKKQLLGRTRNLELDNINTKEQTDSLNLTAIAYSGRNFTKIGNKIYLSSNFLPYPHNFAAYIDSSNKLITYKAFHNNFEIKLKMANGIKLLKSARVYFEKEGMQFSFHVTQPKPDELKIYYYCKIDHLIIDKSLRSVYNQLNSIINETFNQAIIYENL